MSIVNSIETVRGWLNTEVCPLVKLKLPDDNATDASYPYKLVNPAAFSLFVPSKDRTPPKVAAPIPSVCVQLTQGEVKRFELLRRRSRPTGFRIMLLTRNMTESRRRKMYLMEPETHLKNGRLFSSLCFFSRNLVNRKWIEQQDITAPNF